jgi:hypothetical protein
MSISTKHNQSPAKNAEESTLNKDSFSEKPQESLQEQAKHPTSPSRSSTAENADTSIKNLDLKKLRTSIRNLFYGLQYEIYSDN